MKRRVPHHWFLVHLERTPRLSGFRGSRWLRRGNGCGFRGPLGRGGALVG